jgi:hypothetical protein
LRAKACRGDTVECACQRWRVCVPNEVRAAFFKALEFYSNGMPWSEAVDAADRDMNDRLAIAARLKAAAPPNVTQAQPPQERPGPRIRSL